MKVARANKNENIPTHTLGEFVGATRRSDIATDVLTIESASDYQRLIKLIASIPRPFAIAVVRPR